jgi:hypothetical protein
MPSMWADSRKSPIFPMMTFDRASMGSFCRVVNERPPAEISREWSRSFFLKTRPSTLM